MRISDWSSDVCSSDLVDGVGEVPWGHAPVVAQEGLELGGAELGAGSVGGAQQLHQADQPARLVAHPGGQAAPSVGVDLQTRFGQMGLHPLADLAPGRGVDQLAAHLGERRGQGLRDPPRSEAHTSELQSLMRLSYALFSLKTKNKTQ